MKLKALFEGFQQFLGPRSWILSTYLGVFLYFHVRESESEFPSRLGFLS